MRHIYPTFYHEFRCIANRCEDSCCKDWDIDVDSETEEFLPSKPIFLLTLSRVRSATRSVR